MKFQIPKLKAAGSNPVSRSKEIKGLAQKAKPFFFSMGTAVGTNGKDVPMSAPPRKHLTLQG